MVDTTIKSLVHFNKTYQGNKVADMANDEIWTLHKYAGLTGMSGEEHISRPPLYYSGRTTTDDCMAYVGSYEDDASYLTATNKRGVFNIDTTKDYELELFVRPSESGGAIFRTDNTITDVNSYGISHYKGHTFKLFRTYQTWVAAQAFCKLMGGHLATSTSAEKNEFLKSITAGYTVWLGLSDADEATQGTWKWTTGEDSEYANWYSGEPNGGYGSEPYVQMDSSGLWYDIGEGSVNFFICEWDTLKLKVPNIASTSYFHFNGHTFKYFAESLTWDNAKAACEKLGGHLVTITSEAKRDFVSSIIAGSYDRFGQVWTGGVYDSETETINWETGEAGSYKDWHENNPDGNGAYIQLYNSAGTIPYHFNDINGTNTRPYIYIYASGIA